MAFQLRHPRSDGATHVVFPQLTVLHKLSALVPAPGRHTVRYFGVLSSASPLRPEVVPPPITLGASSVMLPSSPVSPARRATWAQLLRRVYDLDALRCPGCGGKLRIISAITERSATRAILSHLDLDDEPPPPASRPRGPPWLFDA